MLELLNHTITIRVTKKEKETIKKALEKLNERRYSYNKISQSEMLRNIINKECEEYIKS